MKTTLSTILLSLLICGSTFGSLGRALAAEPDTGDSVAPAEPAPETMPPAEAAVKPIVKFERGEYFFAPPAQQTAVQFSYAQTALYKTQTSTLPSGNYANDVTSSSRSLSLSGQYSITKNLATSLNLQYRTDQIDLSTSTAAASTKASGLGDIGVGALYQLPTSFAR